MGITNRLAEWIREERAKGRAKRAERERLREIRKEEYHRETARLAAQRDFNKPPYRPPSMTNILFGDKKRRKR